MSIWETLRHPIVSRSILTVLFWGVQRLTLAQVAPSVANAPAEASSSTDAVATPGTTTATNSNPGSTTERGIRFGEEKPPVQFRVGVQIKTRSECRGVTASVPIPMDWPEQEVRIVKEQMSPEVRNLQYRVLDNGAKQMLLEMPRLDANDEVEAVLVLELRRKPILPPTDTTIYEVPTKVARDVKKFLGDSPSIESRNPKIIKLAKEIIKDKTTGWTKAEAIYDYVRTNVEYRESELKGAVQTLQDKVGDCEAMTSLFVALCRAAKIPARMVWVKDHSYPEFYLVDDADKGHWFPCQISGARAFGEMPETRAIIQKGDNYRVPETRERKRYLSVQLKALTVKGAGPKITEVMEYVGNE